MRKILFFGLALILIFSLGTVAEAKTVLKLGHYANAEHAGNQAAKMFADGVAARTNGEVTVEIYPNNELGNPPEVLEQSVLGVIDMSLPTQGQLAKYFKKFGCVMLPFAYDGYERTIDVHVKNLRKKIEPDPSKPLYILTSFGVGYRFNPDL